MLRITDHEKIIEEMKECQRCPLHENRTNVVVGDYGKRAICFVGEGPGFNEDKQGRPFVGRSGKLLDEMLTKVGMSRSEVSVLNIVKCRPPENRAPTSSEMQICGNTWLNRQLEFLNPRFIIPLGSTALKYFSAKSQITRDNAKLIDVGQFKLIPLFHPSYILRKGGDTNREYLLGFQKMMDIVDEHQSKDSNSTTLEDFFV